MNECKTCHHYCDLIKMIISMKSVTMEEVEIAIGATEKLLTILKTYREAC